MTTGRNDPCPCGSGKKYKRCCLAKTATSVQDLHYQRLSDAYDRLVDRLSAHAEKVFGREAVRVAMDELLLWPEEEDINEETLRRIGPLFWPFYLFNWEYDPIDALIKLEGPEERTVAELYAESRGSRLDSQEKLLIESINRRPYTFMEVISVNRGRGMTLQDILKGDLIEVCERMGSQYAQPGDVFFGRAVTVDGVGMLIGLAPTIIPPGHKTAVIQLRRQMRRNRAVIDDEALYDWDTEIRDLYFDIDHSLQAGPQMCNTDGHLLEFHRLIYDISSTDEAFKKLCGLCVTMTPEELSADAERDDTGRIVRIEFPWNRHGHKKLSGLPNTTLGHISIDGQRLTAEANSAQRAAALRREIDTRLGDIGQLKVDVIKDPEVMMGQPADGAGEIEHSKEHKELMKMNPMLKFRRAKWI